MTTIPYLCKKEVIMDVELINQPNHVYVLDERSEPHPLFMQIEILICRVTYAYIHLTFDPTNKTCPQHLATNR